MNPFRPLSPLPAAVLWDMDGTIVDSEPYWMRAETELVESFGGVWTHSDCMLLVGSGLLGSAAILQDRGVRLDAEVIVDRLTTRVQGLLSEFGAPWRPGALELMTEVKAAGIPMALVTMSEHRMAQQVSDQVGFAAFDAIVAGDMVLQSKPHPEAYLSAARLLGVTPADCVAVEDSLPGIAAAVASGAVVIAVPHMVEIEASARYELWPTLHGRTLAGVHTVFAERRAAVAEVPARPGSGSHPTEDDIHA
ncbi:MULTISPECIES: HAD family hydrolase [unclassified Cryobacterium]|uniref:HAD family hydrolase n=1 Tax=unclassified Cryobacterium TaxID=2649013 RepID=UPI0021031E4D|nr:MULTISPECIES: HAD family phosphatase [unclassified Cryobacterium]MDY7527768.1 HAD family phosphatase [Cryobacterium sp. 10C2]MDY7556461.1 HAD family phosphatase [Cryobacterium sp. 10C3]MEB0001730.1 HAD family phosphatase [Cryobacterium sp. RTC2.1]MEB0200203.1 HAD family phosphatase [Cryobacterium sp. 5I3]MEB0285105.1 HAD family phosphatase [Cryobacterium sp. 10S3]